MSCRTYVSIDGSASGCSASRSARRGNSKEVSDMSMAVATVYKPHVVPAHALEASKALSATLSDRGLDRMTWCQIEGVICTPAITAHI